MTLLLYIFLSVFADDGINKIAKINEYKAAANEAYAAADYKAAAAKFRYLYDTLQVREDPIVMNLGHSYFHLGDTTNARSFYGILTASKNDQYRSIAHQQLGVISSGQKKYQAALSHFKDALRANPANEEARYNYELTKKLLEQQQKQEQQDKNKKTKPSEFAKKLKARADEYVRNNRFTAAYNLMAQGLQQDPTVSAYNDFINKLKDIAEVEANP